MARYLVPCAVSVVILFVVIATASDGMTDGERFLAQKDLLIAEFRGFGDRAEALERECRDALRTAAPEKSTGVVLEAERRGDAEFGSEKQVLLSRRRAELFVMFVPDPDNSDEYVERRRGRMQASEKHWRQLFLERQEMRLRAVAAVAEEFAKEKADARAALEQARLEEAARKASRRDARPKRPVVTTPVVEQPDRLSLEKETSSDTPPAPKPTKEDLLIRLVEGIASEGDAAAYESLVFPDGVPSWVASLRPSLVSNDAAQPSATIVESLEAATEVPGDRRRWLLPYVSCVLDSGVGTPRLALSAVELFASQSAAGHDKRAASLASDLAGGLERAVNARKLDSFASLLERVPASDCFSSQRERAVWMVSAIRSAGARLREGRGLTADWLLRERVSRIEADYEVAVKGGDQETLLACAKVWKSLNSRDPMPHLIEALVHGSLCTKGANEGQSRSAARVFDKLCASAMDSDAAMASVRRLGLLAVLDELGLPDRGVAAALKKSGAIYALPERSALNRKVKALISRIEDWDDRISDDKGSIRKLQRQLARVSPNDRRYIQGKVETYESNIKSKEKSRAKEVDELEAARRALSRMERFRLR